MASEAKNNPTIGYEQELIRIMREHELIIPEDEDSLTEYLLIAQ